MDNIPFTFFIKTILAIYISVAIKSTQWISVDPGLFGVKKPIYAQFYQIL